MYKKESDKLDYVKIQNLIKEENTWGACPSALKQRPNIKLAFSNVFV